MSGPLPPHQNSVTTGRRRIVALAVFAAVALAAYLVLAATVFAPVDTHGAQLDRLEIDSKAVGRQLGVNVIVPPRAGPRGDRSLLVFMHGRGGDENSFNQQVLDGLPRIHGRQFLVAFPDGGDHGYFHDRGEGDWDAYIAEEVIPLVERRYGVDPDRVAIGGISMGGFGAYDIALHHPGMFCAVGGHSPALWFAGGETAPGAFDDAADFERNDVIGTIREDPDAFGDAKVWNDYGSEDDFRVYDEGFVEAMASSDTDFTTHSWHGGHESSYWSAHWPDYQQFYLKALRSC